MTTNNTPSLLLALPEDVQRRLLAGCPYEDLPSLPAVCRAFRDVVKSPRFTTARRLHGFIEREVVLVGGRSRQNAVNVHSAQTRAIELRIRGLQHTRSTTTDGRRLFFSCSTFQTDGDYFQSDYLHGYLHPEEDYQEVICMLDIISRKWSRFAPLPPNKYLKCMECYRGRLYILCGDQEECDSFLVYNEATGSWDALTPMPVPATYTSSAIIGDLLLIVCSSDAHVHNTLHIFDFTTGQWRQGPSTPPGTAVYGRPSVGLQGKLFVSPSGYLTETNCLLIYDPRTDAWARENVPSIGPWKCACAHDGRIIVFLHNEGAYERAPDGSWSAYTCTALATGVHMTSPSDGWGQGRTRAESILLG